MSLAINAVIEYTISMKKKKAKALKEDTLVSMVEGIYNSIYADKLDKMALEIRDIIKTNKGK